MPEVDTSSYPKLPTTQQNPLDTISKIQGIQQGAQQIQRNNIAIDSDKLDLFNKHSNTVKRGLGGLLATPEGELTFDHVNNQYKKFIDAGIMTPEQYAKEVSSMPTQAGSKSPQEYEGKVRKFLGAQLLQAQETGEMINQFAGRPADKDAGNQTVFGTENGITVGEHGLGRKTFQQQGSSLGRNPAPGTSGVDQNNNPAFQQNAPPQYIAPPGSVQSKLPVAQDVGPANAASNQERVNQGGGAFRPAPPTNFTEGKEQYNKDIGVATDRLTQIKPAQQALKLMTPEILSGLTGTGPIADKLTKGISAVNGVFGLKGDLADKVAARQEIVKKMNKYVSNSSVAGRSDAAQTLAEASSPNPNVQSLKALVNLTRDAIASDRVEAARALSFENKGNNYNEYQFHRAEFPNAIDSDAFKLDLMPAKERDELIEKMKNSDNKTERERFINSLKIAKKLKMFD